MISRGARFGAIRALERSEFRADFLEPRNKMVGVRNAHRAGSELAH
jgi:hypothetical protein